MSCQQKLLLGSLQIYDVDVITFPSVDVLFHRVHTSKWCHLGGFLLQGIQGHPPPSSVGYQGLQTLWTFPFKLRWESRTMPYRPLSRQCRKATVLHIKFSPFKLLLGFLCLDWTLTDKNDLHKTVNNGFKRDYGLWSQKGCSWNLACATWLAIKLWTRYLTTQLSF